MTPPEFLMVRNFGTYQHYKDRNPPWVKLYRALLDDADLMCLPDASKWLAVGLLLVSAKYDNKLPNNPKWVANLLHMETPADLEALVNCGWLTTYDASSALAKGYRRKRSRGTEKQHMAASPAKRVEVDPEGFAEAWAAFPKRVGDNPRRGAVAAYRARVAEGHTPQELLEGVRRYAAWCEREELAGTRFTMQAVRFFGKEKAFTKPWEATPAAPSAPSRADLLRKQGYFVPDVEGVA